MELGYSPSKRNSLKKHRAVIQIDARLSPLERLLYNVLLMQAYDHLPTKRTHEIPAKIVMMLIGWDRSENTAAIREMLNNIMTTTVKFNLLDRKNREQWSDTTLISWNELEGGMIRWRYDESMVERLHNPSFYATIYHAVQRRMMSQAFALPLYENTVAFCDRKTGRVMESGWWTLDELKRLIGATSDVYQEFRYLRRDALDPAVKQINAESDIQISYSLRKERRFVTHVSFTVQPSKQRNLWPEGDTISGLEIAKQHPLVVARLKKIKLADGVVGMMFAQHPLERVQEAITITEQALHQQRVHSSAAGFMRATLDNLETASKAVTSATMSAEINHAVITKINVAIKDRNLAKSGNDDRWQLQLKTQEKILALTVKEKNEFASEFIAAYPDRQTTYEESTGAFVNRTTTIMFKAWLKSRVAKLVASN
jgi:Initiator Replication protein